MMEAQLSEGRLYLRAAAAYRAAAALPLETPPRYSGPGSQAGALQTTCADILLSYYSYLPETSQIIRTCFAIHVDD